MKIYTVALKKPFDVNIKKALQLAGANFRFSTELNPHMILVEAESIEVLSNLEFVSDVKKSGLAKLCV